MVLLSWMLMVGCGGGLTVSEVVERHRGMHDVVTDSMNQERFFHDGTWHEHYGDGLMFGPSSDLAHWAWEADESYKDRAIEGLDTNLATVAAANDDLLTAFNEIETVAMAQLSLLEAGLFLEPEPYLEVADPFLDTIDGIFRASGDYWDVDAGEFASDTYGPTSLSGFAAMMHLAHVMVAPDDDPDAHIERAEQVLASVEEKAWDSEAGMYRFSPGDDRVLLYPSASMLIAHGRAYALTGDEAHIERTEAIYEGIQVLLAESGDHYHSPYSAEEMGSVDEDYATLSAENYLMLGLWLAYENTEDVKYLEDMDRILGWIEQSLLVDGLVLHHWVNGRAANEEDPWILCAGCNLQLLYILRTMALSMEG
ncbi:MAG: hypothetical protein VX519_01820 [Myxococcota bacterium]|nr:hypothetical protein [Myxococcota bacterium]